MDKKFNLKLGKKHFIIFGCVLLIVLGFIFFRANFSGNVILSLDADYHEGENLDGMLKLSLTNGEFIPASSKVIFETSNQRREFILEDVFFEQPVEGTYYIQGQNLSGQGNGYGLAGMKKSYPEVSFEFNVYSKSEEAEEDKFKETTKEDSVSEKVVEQINETDEQTNETDEQTNETDEQTNETDEQIVDDIANETKEQIEEGTEAVEKTGGLEEVKVIESEEPEVVPEPENIEEVKEQEQTEAVKKEIKKEVEEEVEVTKEEVEEKSVVTGNVISSIFRSFVSLLRFTPTGQVVLNLETVVSGKTSVNEPFVYNLEKGQTAKLVSGSVTDGSVTFSDDDIQFEVSDESILVSTDYFKSEEGFGINYLGDEMQIFEINLSAVDLNFSEGGLNISFVYGGEEIISLSTVLQEGKIEEGNESVLIEIPELSLQNLTDDEKQIIVQKFGNVSVKTTISKVLDGRLIRNYKIGNYELMASYDYNSDTIDLLEPQMEKDKLNFLRDLIKMISEEKNNSKNVVKFIGSSDF